MIDILEIAKTSTYITASHVSAMSFLVDAVRT